MFLSLYYNQNTTEMKKIIETIKKFFTPYKWETIWTCNAKTHATTGFGFVYVGKIDVKIILQVDTYKDQYRCYMTEGTVKQDVDVRLLLTQFPEIKESLSIYNIII
jgi:hypothetical protein